MGQHPIHETACLAVGITVSDLKIDDVCSDLFRKSSQSIAKHMLAHPGELLDVAPFANRHCKISKLLLTMQSLLSMLSNFASVSTISMN